MRGTRRKGGGQGVRVEVVLEGTERMERQEEYEHRGYKGVAWDRIGEDIPFG